jgi:hypothetical protein
MLGTATAKIVWVGRTASMVFGLALALAVVALVAVSPAARAADGNCQPSGSEVVCTFTAFTSTWTVPDGVTQATFDVFGAQGGSGGGSGGQGGFGGEAKATFSNLQPSSQLQVNVGGSGQAGPDNAGGAGGINGGEFGGAFRGGGGGGASDVRLGSFALADRIIVGGGGGGGGGGTLNCLVSGSGGSGGSGGSLGIGGTDSSGGGRGGKGGTDTSGGFGGVGSGTSGGQGALGIGGTWGRYSGGA